MLLSLPWTYVPDTQTSVRSSKLNSSQRALRDETNLIRNQPFGMCVFCSPPPARYILITKYPQLQICARNTYCCRFEGDITDCCNNTAALLSATRVIGMPTAVGDQAPISSVTIGTPSASSSSSTLPLPGSDEDDCDSQIVPIGAGVVRLPSLLSFPPLTPLTPSPFLPH